MDSPSYQEDEDDHESVLQKQEWVKTQHLLRSKLILEDDFVWTLSSGDLNPDGSNKKEKLKYIGGVDISFLKEDPSTACAAVVVLDADTLEVVHEEFDAVRLQVPYIPGFLAFREAPILLGLLEKMRTNAHPFYPQLLMVDGNGLLHPRGFGLACHLGVLASLPTIGVGKNLHHVDGLSQSEVRRQLEAKENHDKELIPLTGHSGTPWGMAMRSCPGSSKPIYISIGHRISLDSAVRIVKLCCKYRVPFVFLLMNFSDDIAGEARYVCEGKCEDIGDCSGFCIDKGYPKGGSCLARGLTPICCCIVLPPIDGVCKQ